MPIVWREAYPDIYLFLLSDVYSTEHNAFDKAVHGESFNFSILEQGSLNLIRHYKCRSVQEESEVVRTKGIASLEVFQIHSSTCPRPQ